MRTQDSTRTTQATIAALDEGTFDAAVGPGTGLVAVEFGAEWCGPCRVMAPELEAAARALAGRVAFHAVDADTSPALVTRFGVRGLPTILVFRDGALVERIVGAQPRERLVARLGAALTEALEGT